MTQQVSINKKKKKRSESELVTKFWYTHLTGDALAPAMKLFCSPQTSGGELDTQGETMNHRGLHHVPIEPPKAASRAVRLKTAHNMKMSDGTNTLTCFLFLDSYQ